MWGLYVTHSRDEQTPQDVCGEATQLKAKYVFNNSEMTFGILLNWVSAANIIDLFIIVFFIYFSYHSSCRNDQFIALILKLGIEDFTEYSPRSTKDSADPYWLVAVVLPSQGLLIRG